MKKTAAMTAICLVFLSSPQSLLSWLSVPYTFFSWYIAAMAVSLACVMACNILLSQPWRAGVILIEVVGMLINAGILFSPEALSDTIKVIRSEFVHPAFIMQISIILLSMTQQGKIIEFGRHKHLAADHLHGDYHRSQHRSHVKWPREVVA